MFLDASAICAVLLEEADSDLILERIEQAEHPRTSPVAIFESVLALAKVLGGDVHLAQMKVDAFLRLAGAETVAIGEAELDRALYAFDRYGKGRHPARLNMGDCFAYACARTHGVPLLFKGGAGARPTSRLPEAVSERPLAG